MGSWKNVYKIIEYPKEGIISKDIIKTDKENVTLFCMSKGTGISEHTSTREGFVFVLEGEGFFKLEGRKISMMPGVFIWLKNNAIHSVKVTKNTSFILALFEA